MSNNDLFITDSRKTHNKELITSLDDYLKHVERLQEIWDESLWFRGLANREYALIPSIYRRNIKPYDHTNAGDLANSFIRMGKAFLPDTTYTMWHWYHVMQHFGLPTRLLDWTTGAFIALFFALRYKGHNSYQPCVWVLNPYWLNLRSTEEEVVYFSDDISQDSSDRQIANKYLFASEDLPRFPIAVSPPHINERIAAQKSSFTVHGSLNNGLFRLWREDNQGQLAQLRISRKSSERMMAQLFLSGLTESTLFPDFGGLSEELIREYGYETE